MKKEINILWLYPNETAPYSDQGNILVLQQRLVWRNYHSNIINYNIGDSIPESTDLIVGGGREGRNQKIIHNDILRIAPKLQQLIDNNTPMLLTGGLFQLFGKSIKNDNGTTLHGANIFKNMHTVISADRVNGNIIAHSEQFGDIFGYENHTRIIMLNGLLPLAKVNKGVGNNNSDNTEGARYKNAIGSNMHGAMLAKNPKIADFLLEHSLTNKKGKKVTLKALGIDNTIINQARKTLKTLQY